jgi:hypothetical protein
MMRRAVTNFRAWLLWVILAMQVRFSGVDQITALWELNWRLGAKIFFSSLPPDWLLVSRAPGCRLAAASAREKECSFNDTFGHRTLDTFR